MSLSYYKMEKRKLLVYLPISGTSHNPKLFNSQETIQKHTCVDAFVPTMHNQRMGATKNV